MEIAKKLSELHHKLDCSYNDLNAKVEALNTKVIYLEGQSASTSAPKVTGLPGKLIQNSKEYANVYAITIRSGRELYTRERPKSVTEDSAYQDGEDFSLNKDEVDKPTEVLEPILDLDTQPTNPLTSSAAVKLVAGKNNETTFIPSPYKPPLPFPGRHKKELKDKYKAMFAKNIKEVELRIHIADALTRIPDSQKFLKYLIMERIQEVQKTTVLSHECSAIIQKNHVSEKLGDPGSSTLPCSLGSLTFNKCLCDLGALVNLMPLSVAKRLGFNNYKYCNISLILVDRCVRLPHGLLEDLPIKIGNVEVPRDFVVLNMDEEPKDPLILGKLFLATAGAIIDVKQGKIDLNLGNNFEMKFDINNAMKKPTIEEQTFLVKEVDQLACELLVELEEANNSKTVLTKSGKAGYLPSETLSSEKSLDSHKAAVGSEVYKGLMGSDTKVLKANELSSTHARPTNSTNNSKSGAGRYIADEVEYPHAGADTEQGGSSMAWKQSQAAIDDQLR